MAEGHRRSSRLVKINQRSDYVYEESLFRSLSNSDNSDTTGKNSIPSEDTWQTATATVVSESVNLELASNYEDSVSIASRSVWSELENLPSYQNTVINSSILQQSVNTVSESPDRRLSQIQRQNTQVSSVSDSVQFSPSYVNIGTRQRNSSTRFDFLDLDNNYLSMASNSELSDAESPAEAGNSKKCPTCKIGDANKCAICEAQPGSINQLSSIMMAALSRMDDLNSKVTTLEQIIIHQNDRLVDVEKNGSKGSGKPGEGASSTKKHGKSKDKKSKKKSKEEKAIEDRERQLAVMLDKVSSRDMGKESSVKLDEHFLRYWIKKKRRNRISTKKAFFWNLYTNS